MDTTETAGILLSVPRQIEDEARAKAYAILMDRRNQQLTTVPGEIVFLTRIRSLHGATLYGHKVWHVDRRSVGVLKAALPIISGERLERLLQARAEVPVDNTDLDRWERDVQDAIPGFLQFLVQQDLADVVSAEHIAVTPVLGEGPGSVLLQWKPPGIPNATITLKWRWFNNVWGFLRSTEISDPLYRA